MIKTKEQLREVLRCEKAQYYKKKSFIRLLSDAFINESCMEIWKYQRVLRLAEYHFNNKRNPMHVLLYLFYARRMNKLGIRLGIYIPINVFDIGLKLSLIHIYTDSRIAQQSSLAGDPGTSGSWRRLGQQIGRASCRERV